MKVDVNKPLENPKLKELFKKLKEVKDNNEYMEVMNEIAEEIMMNAHFLSVVEFSKEPEAQENGTSVFKEDTTMSLPMLTNTENISFYPAFIDWEELYKWEFAKKENLKTLILNIDDYMTMLKDNNARGLAINPFSDNLILDKDTLNNWKAIKEEKTKGVKKITIEKDTQVILGTPSDYPTEMVNKIKEYAGKDKRIKAIWLRLMIKNEEKSYLLVIDFTGDRDEVLPAISDVAVPFLPKGFFIDMIPLNTEFGESAVKNEQPFYKKKFSLFF